MSPARSLESGAVRCAHRARIFVGPGRGGDPTYSVAAESRVRKKSPITFLWEDELLTPDKPDTRSAATHGEAPIRSAPAVPGQSPAAENQEVPIAPPDAPQIKKSPAGRGQEQPIGPAPMIPAAGQQRPVAPSPAVPMGKPTESPRTGPRIPTPPAPATPGLPTAGTDRTASVRPAAAAPLPNPPQPGLPLRAPEPGPAVPAAAPAGIPTPHGGQTQQPVPTATPVSGHPVGYPVATPPPVPPPTFVGGNQTAHASSSAWQGPAQPAAVPGVPSSAPSQGIRVSKTRWGRRPRRQDSSQLALMFLMGAAFLLLSVVMIIVIVLFL